MTDTARVARIYVVAIALLVSVLLWSVLSATPLPGSAPVAAQVQPAVDPRVAQLQQRRAELVVLRRQVARRNATYQAQRRKRLQQIAAVQQRSAAPATTWSAPRASSAQIVAIPAVRSAPAPQPDTSTSSS